MRRSLSRYWRPEPEWRERMNSELIYDVGVNDGADTAFYLSLGYRVMGIERPFWPSLCATSSPPNWMPAV